MIHGENGTVVAFAVKEPLTGSVMLEVRPLIQGTVRARLMGPFITAYVKLHGRSAALRQQASTWIDGMCAHLHDVGLGQVSEISGLLPRLRDVRSIANSQHIVQSKLTRGRD